ncbi:MAG: GNAT family N-acetyltransferase [Candidatus Lokiarchaeota archaeon]|nr:GNAT family N-acetyltransferase [Candidatus Lokiarchaeota archaeon]
MNFDQHYLTHTLKETAIEFNMTVDQVRYKAKNLGLVKPPKDPPNKKHIDIDELYHYYQDHTLEECTHKFGCSPHVLGTRLRKAGYETGIHYADNHDLEFIKEYLKDHTLKECADKCGVGVASIRSFLRRNNINNIDDLRDHINIKELIEYYQSHTMEECGKYFGCSYSTIGRLLNKHGINTDIHFGEEFKHKMSIVAKRRWGDPEYRKKMAEIHVNRSRVSKLQLMLYMILDNLGITYYREYEDRDDDQQCHYGPFSFDCAIPLGHKIVLIECNGVYWHSLPTAVQNDRLKFDYIAKNHPECEIKYIWEHEFKSVGKIVNLIKYWCNINDDIYDFCFKDVIIKKVSKSEVDIFISSHHYIGSAGRCGNVFAAYLGDVLIGSVVFSPLIRQNLPHDYYHTTELSRLCIHPRYQKKNFASWLISQSIKRLPRRYHDIIAYSDTTFNHRGTIYKASNFEFMGEVKPDYWYIDADGYYTHKKSIYYHAKKSKITEAAYVATFGLIKVMGKEKLKYIYHRNQK